MLSVRYKYDGLSHLIREDNKALNKTTVWEYDAGGNITNRLEYTFSLSDLTTLSPTVVSYSYASNGNRDRLMSYDNKTITYDAIGNPTNYLGNTLVWEKGRQLKSYGSNSYEYNAQGIRTKKTTANTTTQYFLDGTKILAQKDTINADVALAENFMEFLYGVDGVIGFKLNNNSYYYKKNLQGDIIGIYNSDFQLIAKYAYDAWGNHKISYLEGNNFVDFDYENSYTNNSNNNLYIALKNPFRYRSYYFDQETSLYYLNSRYYDSQTGRFINVDDINVLSDYKNMLNGLNLYIYCNNNPVMLTDESGYGFWDWLWGIISGVAIGIATAALIVASIATGGLLGVAIGTIATTMAINATFGGISAIINGTNVAAGILSNAIIGAAIGLSIGIGIMTGGGALGVIPAAFGVLSTNYIAGNLSYLIDKGLNKENISWKEAITAGAIQVVSGLFAFSTGYLMGGVGAYNLPKSLTNLLKSNISIKSKLLSNVARNLYGGIILKAFLFWPINNYLNKIRKQ